MSRPAIRKGRRLSATLRPLSCRISRRTWLKFHVAAASVRTPTTTRAIPNALWAPKLEGVGP